MELMQYDNPEGKWQDVIPYMFINLDYDRDIYISKDTVIVSCLLQAHLQPLHVQI